MAATAPVKKVTRYKKWMAQAACFWETSTVKKMNGQSLLLSLNKITHYFKKWATRSELNELNLNV